MLQEPEIFAGGGQGQIQSLFMPREVQRKVMCLADTVRGKGAAVTGQVMACTELLEGRRQQALAKSIAGPLGAVFSGA